MGITAQIDELEATVIREWDIRICELGNQYNHVCKKSAKQVYLSRNVKEHVSIDLNGQDGSLPIDLDQPIPESLKNRFDVVTNYGTTEHVSDQYQVFKNINDLCKTNGIMIHALIPLGYWKGHGRYYYSLDFVKSLSQICNYTIVKLEEILAPSRNLIFVAYKKNNFADKSTFDQLPIVDSGNVKNTGNYHCK